jgi:hypothetical protein
MPIEEKNRLIELLEKSLIIQLHSIGVPQGDIAKMVSKSKTYVNEFLKPIAKEK